MDERVLDPVPLGAVADADAEVEVAVPFRRIALRYTGISNFFARHRVSARTHDEPVERLSARLVYVDAANTAEGARRDVVEPDRVVRRDRHREVRDGRAVVRRAEARVEPVDRRVRVVCGDARRRERRLGRAVVALGDWWRERRK